MCRVIIAAGQAGFAKEGAVMDEYTNTVHDDLLDWYAAAVEKNDREWAARRKNDQDNMDMATMLKKQWGKADIQKLIDNDGFPF